MSEKINYESSIKKLEKIVSDLEGGKLSLDDSLKSYEEGIKLAAALTKKLNEAKKKIDVLTKKYGTEDDFELEEFDTDE